MRRAAPPPAHSLLSDYFPPEKRATVLAVYACGIYMGVGLGFWLGGWLNDAFGWRVAFMVIGLPGVAMAVVVRFTVREPPRGMSERTVAASRAYSLGETWRFLTRLPSGRRISLAAAFQAFVGYGLAAWIPAFFIRLHGMTPGEVGLVAVLDYRHRRRTGRLFRGLGWRTAGSSASPRRASISVWLARCVRRPLSSPPWYSTIPPWRS